MITLWVKTSSRKRPQPLFSRAFTDAGAGAVNLGTGATFTRATVAWTFNSSGLLVQVASGTARSYYDPSTLQYGGYLSEGASTNQCLQSRDFTSASWTKTSMTAAKDQTGIDGAANSASSLTATGANGTVTQAITDATSTARRFSVWMKRITGSGQALLSLDNGSTTADVSAQINSSTWKRVGRGQTMANPTVMIKLVTSGDKIAVDVAQEEALAFDTSPIVTTTATVTRNAESLTYLSAGNIVGTLGGAYAEITSSTASTQAGIIESTSGGYPLLLSASNLLSIYDMTSVRTLSAITRPITTITKVATRWGGSVSTGSLAGVITSGAFDGDLNVGTTLTVGGTSVGGENINGTIKNLQIFNTAVTDAQLRAMTT